MTFSNEKGSKKEQRANVMQWFEVLIFRKRGSDFSLRFRSIGSSDFFGPRRKVVLRGKGNAWAPISWSFEKLREVGVLSYLKLHFI